MLYKKCYILVFNKDINISPSDMYVYNVYNSNFKNKYLNETNYLEIDMLKQTWAINKYCVYVNKILNLPEENMLIFLKFIYKHPRKLKPA